LAAVRDQLIKVTEVAPAYVRIVANDDYKVTYETKLLCIRPLGRRPFVNAGAGRRARPSYRTLRVWIETRSRVDHAGNDLVALTKHFDFEDEVINALDDFYPPVSTADAPLTIEPLHFLDSGAGAPTREAVNEVGVVKSFLDFEYTVVVYNDTPQP